MLDAYGNAMEPWPNARLTGIGLARTKKGPGSNGTYISTRA